MNQLVSSSTTFGAEVSQFCTLIKTEITLKNGRPAAALTLLTELGMFDAAVMGLNQALKSDGRADNWQNHVFSLTNGRPDLFTSFERVYSEEMLSRHEQITILSNVINNLRDELATAQQKLAATVKFYRDYTNKQLNDLIAAHKRIGALEYTLERHGIAVPNSED